MFQNYKLHLSLASPVAGVSATLGVRDVIRTPQRPSKFVQVWWLRPSANPGIVFYACFHFDSGNDTYEGLRWTKILNFAPCAEIRARKCAKVHISAQKCAKVRFSSLLCTYVHEYHIIHAMPLSNYASRSCTGAHSPLVAFAHLRALMCTLVHFCALSCRQVHFSASDKSVERA